MDIKRKYLNLVAATDESLQEHDDKHHDGHYEEGQKCIKRERRNAHDRADDIYGAPHVRDKGVLDVEYERLAGADMRKEGKRLLDDVAINKGYSIEAYHGMPHARGFEKTFIFDRNKLGDNTNAASAKKAFFFAKGQGTAANYASNFDSKSTMMSWFDSPSNAREWVKILATIMCSLDSDVVPQKAFDRVGQTIRVIQSDNFTPEQKKESVNRMSGWFADNLEDIFEEITDHTDDEDKQTEELGKIDRLACITSDDEIQGETEGKVYPIRLKITNPLVHDFSGSQYRDITFSDLIDEAIKNGNDGLILENVKDGAGRDTIYCVFDEGNIKLNRVFNYDNDGNLIPLSNRFNSSVKDSRY